MTTNRPPRRWPLRLLLLATAAACAASIGCKGEANDRIGMLRSDPLRGDRIPRQDLPVPGRDGYGSSVSDPLMRADGKRKEPFRPNLETTPSVLASSGLSRDGGTSDLRIPDDRRTGGSVAGRSSAMSASGEQLAEDLTKMGAKLYPPEKRSNGEYEFRCAIPNATSGALTTYVGRGTTRDAAIRDAHDQVRTDLRTAR